MQANEGGVRIFGDASTANSILSNSGFSNSGLGIELQSGASDVTPNDVVSDVDTGPDNPQNFPMLSSAKTGRRATTIKEGRRAPRTKPSPSSSSPTPRAPKKKARS